ncbi:MAG: PLP-dependent aspartate aminotransferase family protein [Terriglobales bacterium]
MDSDHLDITTRIVHAGERRGWPTGHPVSTPIYASATFTYDSMAEMDLVFSGEKPGFVYTRHGNPTVAALEQAIQTLEDGAAACAYASGMAALHAALLACELGPGATILASQDLYGATLGVLLQVFGLFGVRTVTCDFGDLAAVEAKAREHRPRVLLIETISNPLLKVCDIPACARIAHELGAKLVVDNTFATPYLCRPLEHGADIVVHSATKYLSGHADVMGGVAVVREKSDLAPLISMMKLVGGVLGPWEAHEILRGVKTLALRLERQCANAQYLAEQLAADSRVARVYYPSLRPEQQQAVRRMLRSPCSGAMVSIELADNSRDAAFAFMDALRLCVRSTSLGDVFTGVLHPATASHRDVAPARRRQAGINDGLIRISVGIEHAVDILADIQQALTAATGKAAGYGALKKAS